MSTYHTGYLSLTALVLAAGPLVAQDKAEPPPLRMIYAVWKDTTGAGYAMNKMSQSAKDQVEAYAVLVKDAAGHVRVKQRHNQAGGSARALQASQIVDTAIARLSAPPPSAADSASGYAPAGHATRLSEEDLKKVVGMFEPGESALLLLSPQPSTAELQRSLGAGAQSNAEIVELEVKPEAKQ